MRFKEHVATAFVHTHKSIREGARAWYTWSIYNMPCQSEVLLSAARRGVCVSDTYLFIVVLHNVRCVSPHRIAVLAHFLCIERAAHEYCFFCVKWKFKLLRSSTFTMQYCSTVWIIQKQITSKPEKTLFFARNKSRDNSGPSGKSVLYSRIIHRQK